MRRRSAAFVLALAAITAAIVMLVWPAAIVDAQAPINTWRSIGPTNISGPISDLLIDPADPNVLIVSSDGGGLWRSTNAGANWTEIDRSLPTLALRALARNPVKPDVLYGAGSSGVLRSLDRGATWRALSSFTSQDVRKVAVSADGQLVIASVPASWNTASYFQSADEGQTWTAFAELQSALNAGGGPGDLAVSPVIPRRAIATSLQTPSFSCYSFQLFAPVVIVPSICGPAAFATADPEIFYIARSGSSGIAPSSGRDIYRGSGTITQLTGSIGGDTSVAAIWVDPTNSNTIVVGARDLWRSIDGGVTFAQISDWEQFPQLPGGRHYVIRSDPGFNGTTNRRVYVGTSAGLFRTDNIYSTTAITGWTALGTIPNVTSFATATFAADGAIIGLTTNQEALRIAPGSTVASRAATSAAFRETPAVPSARILIADPQDASFVYGADLTSWTLFRSADGGRSFTAMPGPPTTSLLRMIAGDPLDGSRLYAFYNGSQSAELYRTSNARAATPAWELVPTDLSAFGDASAFAPGSSSTFWLAADRTGARLLRSTNMNAAVPTFASIHPASIGHYVERLTMAASDGLVGYVRSGAPGAMLMHRTADGGSSWTNTTDVGGTVNALSTHPDNPDWVLAGTDAGVYQSGNGGTTWALASPARVKVSSLAWRGTTLLAATQGLGLWTIDLPGEPLILSQPTNQFVPAGRTATFSVASAGAPAVTYQWQTSTDGGTTWTNLSNNTTHSGVTTNTLTITFVYDAQSGSQFRTIVSNSRGTVTSNPAILTVPAAPSSITVGNSHACILTALGGVSCWGSDSAGELGDGTASTVPRLIPAPVMGLQAGMRAVSAGGFHTCALSNAGGVVCWGDNQYGQLGDGTTVSRSQPVAVIGLSTGVTGISAGDFHTCATTAGTVLCWGANAEGQLGDGSLVNRASPVAVSGLPSGIGRLAAGSLSTCALDNFAGGATCWGAGLPPVPVAGLPNGIIIIDIVIGAAHACASTAVGVYCWGINSSGQLGDGTTTSHAAAAPVIGMPPGPPGPVLGLAAGAFHTCALTTARAFVCWGGNLYGQLGDATKLNRPTPVTVSALSSGVTAIAAGHSTTCAVIGGGARCIGLDLGQKDVSQSLWTTSSHPKAVDFGLTATPFRLQFGVTRQGATVTVPEPQTIGVLARDITTTWAASSDQPWLQLSRTAGTGAAQIAASLVNFGNIFSTATTLTATITVMSTTVGLPVLSAIPVTVNVSSVSTSSPFGSLDTPASGSSVAGSIAVTGWALDDLGVSRVELWRDLVAGETTPAYTGPGPGSGKIFIANALFVSGARPDVEFAYPDSPQVSRAGWGYMMLTHGLWNLGNGTFTLHAFAYDQHGNVGNLGSKTFTSNNATSGRPFGTIDTPAQGQTVTGSFWNYGWALTPLTTPPCAVTGVQVSLDSGPLSPVIYGGPRTDIAAAFPGLPNSTGAGGEFFVDTTTLTNGVHQIAWLISDSCNRSEGVGSRFFTVLNGSGTIAIDEPASAPVMEVMPNAEPIVVRRGSDEQMVLPDAQGDRVMPIGQGERIAVQLPGNAQPYTGAQIVNGARRVLPLGSSLDVATGTFYWEPAAGFLGAHDLEFEAGDQGPIRVRAIVGTSVQAVIDTPAAGDVSSSFVIAGWAIDQAAKTGTGIDTVHVWAYPAIAGAPPIFLGVASYGDARSDIGATFGEQFAGSSFNLLVNGLLSAGDYQIVVYPRSSVTGDFRSAKVVRVTVR